jgi:uncharacterized protein
MKENHSRRQFLKTSLAIPAALAVGGHVLSAADAENPSGDSFVLPKRKLGRNGPEVTILNLGGMMSAHSPQYLDIAWKHGIRYFDTAKVYINGKSEKNIAAWLKRYPERRKELFLVSKEPARNGPEDLLKSIDERLEACGTDYLDLFFMHGIGPKSHGKDSLNWPKSDRFRKVVEEIKESGKAKMVGFSCHDGRVSDYMNAAAEGGFVDAIMLAYNPFFEKGGDFDRAMEACYNAGIGLISMKEMRPFAKAPKKNPALEEVGLTTQQGILHEVWSDHRIASICSSMDNIQQMQENSEAALKFQDTLGKVQRDALKEVAMISPASMCPGCPSCTAIGKDTDFAFQDISRYLSYYEQDGDTDARHLYRELAPAARNSNGIDLRKIQESCQFNVDYPQIVRRAEKYFA